MALPRSPYRRWRGALRFPNGGSCFSPWRRCVMLHVSQRVPLCVPPSRPICLCLARPQSCPCVCHRARVAVLRCVRLAVNVCFAPSNGLSARGRGGAVGCCSAWRGTLRKQAPRQNAAKQNPTAAVRTPTAAKRESTAALRPDSAAKREPSAADRGRGAADRRTSAAVFPRGGGARMGMGDLALRCNAGKAQQGLNN